MDLYKIEYIEEGKTRKTAERLSTTFFAAPNRTVLYQHLERHFGTIDIDKIEWCAEVTVLNGEPSSASVVPLKKV